MRLHLIPNTVTTEQIKTVTKNKFQFLEYHNTTHNLLVLHNSLTDKELTVLELLKGPAVNNDQNSY